MILKIEKTLIVTNEWNRQIVRATRVVQLNTYLSIDVTFFSWFLGFFSSFFLFFCKSLEKMGGPVRPEKRNARTFLTNYRGTSQIMEDVIRPLWRKEASKWAEIWPRLSHKTRRLKSVNSFFISSSRKR